MALNPHKLAFIIEKGTEENYTRLLEQLIELEIPDGYEVDLVTVNADEDTTVKYQNAMSQSDAKYKFYLDASIEARAKRRYKENMRRGNEV